LNLLRNSIAVLRGAHFLAYPKRYVSVVTVHIENNKPRFGGVCYLAPYRYNARLPESAEPVQFRLGRTIKAAMAW
jgi:hypothetical protein